jgi:hypothetical protein
MAAQSYRHAALHNLLLANPFDQRFSPQTGHTADTFARERLEQD